MKQNKAYAKITNRYDDVLTAHKWWSRLYMNCIWRVDDNLVAKEVLEMLPDDFQGKILDIPVGTVFLLLKNFVICEMQKLLVSIFHKK
ncbi:MAG TPA: hypothetical protein PLK15_07915, partial [Chitinophagales bacterium]|nr:hypothetical protein [Chitinophagales bacterium]